MLRGLPFLTHVPVPIFDAVLEHGQLLGEWQRLLRLLLHLLPTGAHFRCAAGARPAAGEGALWLAEIVGGEGRPVMGRREQILLRSSMACPNPAAPAACWPQVLLLFAPPPFLTANHPSPCTPFSPVEFSRGELIYRPPPASMASQRRQQGPSGAEDLLVVVYGLVRHSFTGGGVGCGRWRVVGDCGKGAGPG